MGTNVILKGNLKQFAAWSQKPARKHNRQCFATVKMPMIIEQQKYFMTHLNVQTFY
jgi:hypothetical protein